MLVQPADEPIARVAVLHQAPCLMEYVMENVCPDEADDILTNMAMSMAEEMLNDYLENQANDVRLQDRIDGDD
jgi:hypothetical protein